MNYIKIIPFRGKNLAEIEREKAKKERRNNLHNWGVL